MAQLRRLNDQGVERMKEFLAGLGINPATPVPVGILYELTTSEELPVNLEVQDQKFGSRMAAAEYLYSILSGPGTVGLDRDPGVWAWLSLFYFDELCPKRKDGTRKVLEVARFLASSHAFRYYRHLLAGPYLIFKAFRDDPTKAKIVLTGPLDKISDFVAQLASRQDFVQNKAAIEAATVLYFNESTGKPKRGAADTEHSPGYKRRSENRPHYAAGAA